MDEPVTFVDRHADPQTVAPEPAPEAGAGAQSAPPESTGGDMEAQVLEAIEAIRPALQMDGGDMNLVGVDESSGVVEVELVGACGSCPASIMTLSAGIERILKDRVEGVTEVNAVGMDAGL